MVTVSAQTLRALGIGLAIVGRIWIPQKNGNTKPEYHKLNLHQKDRYERKFKVKFDDVKARVKTVPYFL